jgi:hypothetical protein
MIEDVIFNILNYFFSIILWIIIDQERFWTAWWSFLIINIIFIGVFFKFKNDNESS